MRRRTLLTCALVVSCEEAPPRPEVVLYVDTDMPLPSQVGETTSGDATIDTLRIEVFDDQLRLVDNRVLSLAGADELPLSFGIPSDVVEGDTVLVRVRGFRALFSTPGQQAGRPVLDPRPEVTVDRLVSVRLSDEGLTRAAVTLHGDCIGIAATFGGGGVPGRTCVDGDRLDVPVTDALDTELPRSSRAGTWARSIAKDCEQASPAGSRCIPGGLTVLGDPLFLARNELDYDAVPLRVVELSPFHLGETEVTVGQLRALMVGQYQGPMPLSPAEADSACSWDPSSADAAPLNCVDYEAADAICAALGGKVPTEAQWEHAARGRGQRRLYPWGDTPPACCSASLGRVDGGGCEGHGLELVGSHVGSSECPGDVSRDGVLDLAGSVSELVRDSIATSFEAECWLPPGGGSQILRDPICEGPTTRVARGAGWGFAFGDAPLPIRRAFFEAVPSHGFRCAFEDAP